MLKVTLSQGAAPEAVEPAHRVPCVGNPGHGRLATLKPADGSNVFFETW